MSGRGRILVVGLGPGPAQWLTPEASDALALATELIGYGPYVDRIPLREGQMRHASDNRVEIDRARWADSSTRLKRLGTF
jgi:precorrin-3B C17-methyltransferase